ncbi:MAG: hypothetical protein HY686_06715 [Chloroflexi bacterium]|nr:hypothetical protein [Chloroflexota bacterium]
MLYKQIWGTVIGILALVFGAVLMWSSVEVISTYKLAVGVVLGTVGATTIFLGNAAMAVYTEGRESSRRPL